MGDRLLEVIKQVGIFMICAQMILHFKPSDRYNKYIKLLISIMVLVQLTVPLLGIFGGEGTQGFLEKVHFYSSSINEGLKEANITSVNAEILLNEMTMEEVKTRLNNAKQENGEESVEEGLQEEDVRNVEIQIEKIEVAADE